MDRRGSGFKKILSAYKTLPNYSDDKKPVFTSEYDCFFLVMQNMNYGLNEDLEDIQSDTKEKTREKTKEITKENCSDIQKRIIDLIKENPKITVSQMSNALDITIDSANYHIKGISKNPF